MAQKEKAHLTGGPIPNVVLTDNSEFNAELLRFQASLIVQRDDGKWSIGWHEDAPGPFNSRADAARIANSDKPAPVLARNFRRIRIREVTRAAA